MLRADGGVVIQRPRVDFRTLIQITPKNPKKNCRCVLELNAFMY
jgi:hypothetical protein